MVKFLKNSDKDSVFKTSRGKKDTFLYKGTKIKRNYRLIIRNNAIQKAVECMLKYRKKKKISPEF